METATHRVQEHIIFEDNSLVPLLFGEQNLHLHKIENALRVEIRSRGNEVYISGDGDDINSARQVLEALWDKIQNKHDVDAATVDSALRFLDQGENRMETQNGTAGNGHENVSAPKDLKAFTEAKDQIITQKKKIQPRTPRQGDYIKAMQQSNLVFGVGPAGTGKTYLAVAMAVALMEQGLVERLILTRPAVEAGERIGFLPGEMKEKMDPYMRPLYDALQDTMQADKVQKKLLSGEIEIAPLAFMRGRTLSNAFIILDEAQNTTPMQMLMFLTRLGENSHMVVNGDPSQIDLPHGSRSGLDDAVSTLKGTDGMEFIEFTHKDVIRSPLVTKIIQAYEAKKKKT